jgi:uncharacterized heparinase superfamily protein
LTDLKSPHARSRQEIGAIQRAHSIAQGNFSFLQHEVRFGKKIGWHESSVSRLWLYHLHYFDYVRDLLIWGASEDSKAAYGTFRQIACSWIEANEFLIGDGWHPYTISLRIVNWLNALSFFAAELEDDKETDLLLTASTYAQAQILFSDLELDVRGNHLIENLRALIWAGLSFAGDEPQLWVRRALRLLEVEVAEQVLADGGHFERSPGYHLRVFKQLFEIAVWLRRSERQPLLWLDHAIRQMRQYLWTILPPDGSLPLLKDTTRDGEVSPPEMLTAAAVYFDEPLYKCVETFGLYPLLVFGAEARSRFHSWAVHDQRGSEALTASGHLVMRDRKSREYLIFDVGKPCPEYLPAHAHADLLTFELSVGCQPVVVDSGVFQYQAGPWRDYFRSTRAHNTVEIGGENQSEVWGAFRVGRRARPGPFFWNVGPTFVLAQGEHDGYGRLAVPVTHQRTIVYGPESFWVVADQLWGKGITTARSYLHLHPRTFAEQVGTSLWRVRSGESILWITALAQDMSAIISGQTDEPRQGWYSERFGEIQSNTTVILTRQGPLPMFFGYIMSRETPTDCRVAGDSHGHYVEVDFPQRTYRLTLIRGTRPLFS